MSLPSFIQPRNNLACAVALHLILFLGLVYPPDFSASETPENAPPANGAAAQPAKTNSAVEPEAAGTAKSLADLSDPNSQTNSAELKAAAEALIKGKLDLARNLRLSQLAPQAEPVLVALLDGENSEDVQKSALLELSLCAQQENDLSRGLQIYAQFLSRWPSDARAPDVLLRQGQLFRQLGMNSMALAKFYAVMTAALALKNDELEHYQRLVVEAQTEIAETHYQMGKFADAAEYFTRLLKQNSPWLKQSQAQYRLIRCLAELGRHAEAAGQAQDFLTRFPDAEERAEVRFALAHSLKELGRHSEALQQVLVLLREEKTQTTNHPEIWAYWQQRAGNEIANQLYREGDYTRALEVYTSLAQLDNSPSWRIPVEYQIGMTYEHLQQPQLASQTYSNIVSCEISVGTNASPGIESVLKMARWRMDFLSWQINAENATREMAPPHENTAPPAGAKS